MSNLYIHNKVALLKKKIVHMILLHVNVTNIIFLSHTMKSYLIYLLHVEIELVPHMLMVTPLPHPPHTEHG